MSNQFGDVISKLKKVDKQDTPEELQIAEEIFQVKSSTSSSTSGSMLANSKSALIGGIIIMLVYIVLNLTFVLNIFHKFIKSENVQKIINTVIIFVSAFLTMKFLNRN